jgi:DNA-binding MarR family transcriptional regulator
MALTKRRMQLLDRLMELYQHKKLPIHYEALAKSLGISKWTAYDMLKEIEKLGFVSRSYEVNAKETGRSQVVFTPTAQTAELFDRPRGEIASEEAWQKSVHSVKKLLARLTNTGIHDALAKLIAEIPEQASRLEFCSHILGLLLMYVKKVGGKREALIRQIMRKTQGQESGLFFFVGTVLGTIIQTVNEELGLELAELISRFMQTINELTGKEKQWLAEFVAEALE